MNIRFFKCLGVVLLLGLAVAPAEAADELRVHCTGSGPALYLIGGGPAFTTWHLAPIQEHLRNRFRVCRWDMRGVGDNADAGLDRSQPMLPQWLGDMQRVLPDQPVMLWGHSWGALQALLFARDHPQRVKALVLSNPVDPLLRSLDGIERKRFQHAREHEALRLEEIGTPVEALRNLRSKIASYFVDGDKGWDFAQGFTLADTNKALNVRAWGEYRAAPLTEAHLRRLDRKVAGLIACRLDVLQPEAMQEYERLLPRTPQWILAECAHFPWEENPEAYFSALDAALDRAVGE